MFALFARGDEPAVVLTRFASFRHPLCQDYIDLSPSLRASPRMLASSTYLQMGSQPAAANATGRDIMADYAAALDWDDDE